MVLITNRQSNILQDIDSLHLFAQVTTSICKSLDEREILRNAFELLSAYDELVTLGYRENLSLSQIKTFLEMESHEERIQEIIERVLSFPKSCKCWLANNSVEQGTRSKRGTKEKGETAGAPAQRGCPRRPWHGSPNADIPCIYTSFSSVCS